MDIQEFKGALAGGAHFETLHDPDLNPNPTTGVHEYSEVFLA
jgi:hypothetical protein